MLPPNHHGFVRVCGIGPVGKGELVLGDRHVVEQALLSHPLTEGGSNPLVGVEAELRAHEESLPRGSASSRGPLPLALVPGASNPRGYADPLIEAEQAAARAAETAARPWSCEYCGRRYTTEGRAVRHERRCLKNPGSERFGPDGDLDPIWHDNRLVGWQQRAPGVQRRGIRIGSDEQTPVGAPQAGG